MFPLVVYKYAFGKHSLFLALFSMPMVRPRGRAKCPCGHFATMIALQASYDARKASNYEQLRCVMSGKATFEVTRAIIP